MIKMMIKNQKDFHKFEKELIKNGKLDIEHNFRIIEAMYDEAVELGVFPLKNPLEGIETDIKVAKVVNSVLKNTR